MKLDFESFFYFSLDDGSPTLFPISKPFVILTPTTWWWPPKVEWNATDFDWIWIAFYFIFLTLTFNSQASRGDHSCVMYSTPFYGIVKFCTTLSPHLSTYRLKWICQEYIRMSTLIFSYTYIISICEGGKKEHTFTVYNFTAQFIYWV